MWWNIWLRKQDWHTHKISNVGQTQTNLYISGCASGDLTLGGQEGGATETFAVCGCTIFQTFDTWIRGYSQLEPEKKNPLFNVNYCLWGRDGLQQWQRVIWQFCPVLYMCKLCPPALRSLQNQFRISANFSPIVGALHGMMMAALHSYSLFLLLLDSCLIHSSGLCGHQENVHPLKEKGQNGAIATQQCPCGRLGSGPHYFGFIHQVSCTPILCISQGAFIDQIKANSE